MQIPEEENESVIQNGSTKDNDGEEESQPLINY